MPPTETTDNTDKWGAILDALATSNRRALENGARIAALETTVTIACILLATYVIYHARKG